MTFVKFRPFENDTFNDSLKSFFNEFPTIESKNSFSPKFDIYKKDNNLFLIAEISGIDKKDIKIGLQDNTLTIEGEKKKPENYDELSFLRNERQFGTFKRSFTVGEDINRETIDAKFENGILEMKFELIEEDKKEKIIEIK